MHAQENLFLKVSLGGRNDQVDLIDAPVAIFSAASVIEKVTNSGAIHGDVSLGAAADVFTDFVKVKKHGKVALFHCSFNRAAAR